MKYPGKILLTLLLILLLALVACYVLLQTRWGAAWASRQLSDAQYQLNIGKIEHNFSAPGLLRLDDVTLAAPGQPPLLTSRRVDLGLRLAQLTNPQHFASIRLNEGTLNLTDNAMPGRLQADRLLLSRMTVNGSAGDLTVQGQKVDGGVTPWLPEKGALLGQQARFQLSAGSLALGDLTASNALLEGSIKGREWLFSNVGADVALGSITANARRDASGGWQVQSLRLNSIRLQSDKTLADFLQPLLSLPDISFNRVDVTDARLEGLDWAVTDLDLLLKNITFSHGDWQSDNGTLALNASSFVNGSLQLNDPIASLEFSPAGVALTQFSSRWVNGMIRTGGNWSRRDKKLTLDELVVAGLEYTLPANWRERWLQTLPGWLDSVQVSRFTANRNLIIDINPDFPFQMTALDASGSNLLLAQNHRWGIWSGSLSANAAESTFNRVDLRHPSLALNADGNSINVTELSAFSGSGMLEGVANVSQAPQRALSLSLTGRQVNAAVLANWGWPGQSLPAGSNLKLSLSGNLQADKPLKPTVNATLELNGGAQQQKLVNGQLQ